MTVVSKRTHKIMMCGVELCDLIARNDAKENKTYADCTWVACNQIYIDNRRHTSLELCMSSDTKLCLLHCRDLLNMASYLKEDIKSC